MTVNKAFIVLGVYSELMLDVEDISSVEGLPETRGGHIVPDRETGLPKYTKTVITMKSGPVHTVDRSYADVKALIQKGLAAEVRSVTE